MLQEYLLSTRSPGVIADSRDDAYRTALRVLGVSRPDSGPISQSANLLRSDFMPPFGVGGRGWALKMSPPSR